jgi:soluble lytic murein transglycosylase-like protein
VIKQESGFRPCAVSPVGAQGLMQLMPDTADQLRVADAFDPAQNVNGGAAYLKQLLTKYKGDIKLTLGAYNAGPKRTDDAGGVPNIPETQNYVASILADMGSAAALSASQADKTNDQTQPTIQN